MILLTLGTLTLVGGGWRSLALWVFVVAVITSVMRLVIITIVGAEGTTGVGSIVDWLGSWLLVVWVLCNNEGDDNNIAMHHRSFVQDRYWTDVDDVIVFKT